ncbi:hypothetical protein M9H77_19146 [Catharanthus roseus]|uniref:Uncharacterized protein n=1 Tax=Catharanthus roseus TaxID=4058 RepID=A0ACC0B9R3_CATRO|nr:hypothetical protein M9H77_19146 [Catharanthus roseus]
MKIKFLRIEILRVQREPNELGEFAFSMRDEEQPRSALQVENNVNPSVLTGTDKRRRERGKTEGQRARGGSCGSRRIMRGLGQAEENMKDLPAQLPLLKRPT